MDDSNLRSENPRLFNLPKKKIFQVPDGFFKELEQEIKEGYSGKKTFPAKNIRKWLEYSVAAVVAMMLIFSGIKMISEKTEMHHEANRKIYNVKDGDMDRE